MPQIIVVADTPGEGGDAQVMFRERVTRRDFDSGHFATQLAERLGWAVGDAHAVEHAEQAKRIGAAAADAARDRPGDTGDHSSADTFQRRSARVVTTAS
jgi:hypothetical protein